MSTDATAAEKPKPLIPREIKASISHYRNGNQFVVAGYPTVKKDDATGRWLGTSDGMDVEMTPKAHDYLVETQKTRLRPIFKARVVDREGRDVILYEEGIPQN